MAISEPIPASRPSVPITCVSCEQVVTDAGGLWVAFDLATHRCPPRPGVYLLHAERPIGSATNPRGRAQHYIGWADDLDRRTADQLAGNGAAACLPRAFRAAGVALEVADAWPEQTRAFERWLKNRKHASRFCPLCCASTKGPLDA